MSRLTVLVPAVLSAALCAQTPRVSFTAETNVGCFAKVPSRTALVTKRRGQNAYPGVHAIITGDSTIARLYLQSPTSFGVEASLYWYGRAYNTRGSSSTIAGTTQSTDWRSPVQAPHTIMVQFTGRAVGKLTIYYGGSLTGTGGHARVKVDMDANGRTDYSWALPTSSKKLTMPWTINGSRRIRVTGDCKAFTTATGPSGFTYSSSLRFVFEPLDGSFTSYGTGCGPVLTGSMSRRVLSHSMRLTCRNAFASKPCLFIIGGGQTSVTIPGTRCALLTQPLVVAGSPAYSNGYAYLSATFNGFPTGSIYLQAVPWDRFAGKVATSNGLRLQFR